MSWSYYGPWGGHPELPSTRAAICLAFCDECVPDLVWSVRRVNEWEQNELFSIADGESDIYMHAIAGYPMLPWSPEVLIATHDAPFLRHKPDNDPFWAVGVAFDTILLGLESFIGPSRAGTQIVSYWKCTRPHLIAHGVLPSAVPYWQRHGFIAVPCPHPFPADVHPFAVMSWNIPSDAVVARLDGLGIPWWETTERSHTTPRVLNLFNRLYSDTDEAVDET